MWRERHTVRFNGKAISVKQLAEAFGVPYDTCLARYHRGFRNPWEILYGEGAEPMEFKVTQEQINWLRETLAYRKGQVATKGKEGHRESEWDIACDLIGIPRVFANNLKEVMEK